MKRNADAMAKLLQYYRRGRSQYRNCSYLKVQPSGVMKQIGGEGLVRICYKGAACGFGFVLGGLTTTSVDPEAEESIKEMKKNLKSVAKEEAYADYVRKWRLEHKPREQN